jgi:uncharacterized RmlC-like cupin family protein
VVIEWPDEFVTCACALFSGIKTDEATDQKLMTVRTNINKPTCRVVRAATEFTGKQALVYAPGISAESVGAQGIRLQIVTIPPAGRAKAHKHDGHETAIYILSGSPECGRRIF